jgi:hypothetical protein
LIPSLLWAIPFLCFFAWTDYRRRKIYILPLMMYTLGCCILSFLAVPLIYSIPLAIVSGTLLGASATKYADVVLAMATTAVFPLAGAMAVALYILSVRYWRNTERIPVATRYAIFAIPFILAMFVLPI